MIGKENNYVFNLRDDYLNDMSKIDKDFFMEYYLIKENKVEIKEKMKALSNLNDLKNSELIFDFVRIFTFSTKYCRHGKYKKTVKKN